MSEELKRKDIIADRKETQDKKNPLSFSWFDARDGELTTERYGSDLVTQPGQPVLQCF